MSRGLISYRRLVVLCSKMALHGSIIVEICDETMAKTWRKPVKMQGLFACMLFFFGVSSATLIFGVRTVSTSYCCFVLFALVFEKIAPQKLTSPEPYLVDYAQTVLGRLD